MPVDQARALQTFCARTGSDFATLSVRAPAHYYEIEGTDENFDGTLHALRLMAVGRFGNRVWQMLNIVLIARHLGVRQVWFDDVGSMGDFPAEIEGIAFARTPQPKRTVPTLAGIFFTANGFEPLLTPFDAVFAEETLRLFVQPFFRHFQPKESSPATAAIGPDVLVMQFRGGDIFPAPGVGVGRPYVMPPVAFYLQAVAFATARLGVRRVHLVHEDRANPALGAVEDALKSRGVELTSQSRTLEEDVATLLSAAHLAGPFGTFCEGIAMVSTRLRSLFSFRQTESHMYLVRRPYSVMQAVLQVRGVRLLVGTDTAPGYIPPLCWDSSLAQRALMLSWPEHDIAITEVAPFVPPPLEPRDFALAAARAETRWWRTGRTASRPPPLMSISTAFTHIPARVR
jgi:hypothetical protein